MNNFSKWAYRVESRPANDNPQKYLNEIGADGWELVSTVFRPPSRYSDGEFFFYFKRPAPAEE